MALTTNKKITQTKRKQPCPSVINWKTAYACMKLNYLQMGWCTLKRCTTKCVYYLWQTSGACEPGGGRVTFYSAASQRIPIFCVCIPMSNLMITSQEGSAATFYWEGSEVTHVTSNLWGRIDVSSITLLFQEEMKIPIMCRASIFIFDLKVNGSCSKVIWWNHK